MTAHEENDRGPRGALVFLGLATTLAIIDSTIVNVALPSISADIGLSLTAAEWVVSGYGLALASLLISFGRLADRYRSAQGADHRRHRLRHHQPVVCARAEQRGADRRPAAAGRVRRGRAADGAEPDQLTVPGQGADRGVRRLRRDHRHRRRARPAGRLRPGRLVRLAVGVPDQPAHRGRGGDRHPAHRARGRRPRRRQGLRPDRPVVVAARAGRPDLRAGRGTAGRLVRTHGRRQRRADRLGGRLRAQHRVRLARRRCRSCWGSSCWWNVSAETPASRPWWTSRCSRSPPSRPAAWRSWWWPSANSASCSCCRCTCRSDAGCRRCRGNWWCCRSRSARSSRPRSPRRARSVTGRTWVMIGLGLEVAGLVLLAAALDPDASVLWMSGTTADLRRRGGFRHQPADQRHPAGDPDPADRAGERAVQHRTADRFRGRRRGADRDHERGARGHPRRSAGRLGTGDSRGAAHGGGAGHRQQPRRPVGQCDLRHTPAEPAWPECSRRPSPAWRSASASPRWPPPCRSPAPGSWPAGCRPAGVTVPVSWNPLTRPAFRLRRCPNRRQPG